MLGLSNAGYRVLLIGLLLWPMVQRILFFVVDLFTLIFIRLVPFGMHVGMRLPLRHKLVRLNLVPLGTFGLVALGLVWAAVSWEVWRLPWLLNASTTLALFGYLVSGLARVVGRREASAVAVR